MTTRLLSYSEIETAMTCQASWDFKYGGRLAGSTLKAKGLAPRLSEGRAWGAAVAAWHQHSGSLLALYEAHNALRASLDADQARMAESGWPIDLDGRVDMEQRLMILLDHYAVTAEPLPNLTRLEGEIKVPIRSRTGTRASTRYRYHCFIDGYSAEDGQQWIVEFKLRTRLTDPRILEKSRQPRWYAWALAQEQDGHFPVGVKVDERLNEAPKPARLVQARKKGDGINGLVPSHAIDQMTTPEAYLDVCLEFGQEPKAEVVEALMARRWHQRFPIQFRPSELDDAGRELVSAARLIRDLDSGEYEPVRNAKAMNCNFCDFRDVCAAPQDRLFVETMFSRGIPKRLRGDGIFRFAGEDSDGMRLAINAYEARAMAEAQQQLEV